jgi:CheY-like chemotaxis protein
MFGDRQAGWCAACGKYFIPSDIKRDSTRLRREMILILSHDAVAAALIGALIETLGYSVKFARPPESGDDAMRRIRPKVCLLDCDDPSSCNDEILGHATMRGISVVIFGRREALDRVRALASQQDIGMLLVPPHPAELDATLGRAMSGAR